jgi:hypothetical protein
MCQDHLWWLRSNGLPVLCHLVSWTMARN